MTSRTDGVGVLATAGALAEEKRCALRGRSAVAGSGSASSLHSGDITDDMVSLRTSKMVILFVVGISARALSIAGVRRSLEIVSPSSCAPISSSLGPGRLDAAGVEQDCGSSHTSALVGKSRNKVRGCRVKSQEGPVASGNDSMLNAVATPLQWVEMVVAGRTMLWECGQGSVNGPL